MPLLGESSLFDTILFHITTYAPLAQKQSGGRDKFVNFKVDLLEALAMAVSMHWDHECHPSSCRDGQLGWQDFRLPCQWLCRSCRTRFLDGRRNLMLPKPHQPRESSQSLSYQPLFQGRSRVNSEQWSKSPNAFIRHRLGPNILGRPKSNSIHQ